MFFLPGLSRLECGVGSLALERANLGNPVRQWAECAEAGLS